MLSYLIAANRVPDPPRNSGLLPPGVEKELR